MESFFVRGTETDKIHRRIGPFGWTGGDYSYRYCPTTCSGPGRVICTEFCPKKWFKYSTDERFCKTCFPDGRPK